MHQEYIQAITAKAEANDWIRAVWLEGSFGRGTADRYSDLDFHFLLAKTDIESFKADVESWLSTIQPLVLSTLLFDGKLVNALTVEGLRVDIVLHTEDVVQIDPSKGRVLINKGADIQLDSDARSVEPSPVIPILEQQTREFWRCIALLPSVVGRNELIAGCMGLSIEATILTNIIIAGYGIVRDRGAKNLNQFLPPDARQSIETALSMQGLSPATLAEAHLGLARIMQKYGRSIAEKHQYAYPNNLEESVLRYVNRELALLSLQNFGH
jgi:predicted nucleotidyltransferase